MSEFLLSQVSALVSVSQILYQALLLNSVQDYFSDLPYTQNSIIMKKLFRKRN